MTNDAARKREAAGRGLAWRSEWLRLVSRRLGTKANVLACAAELMMRAHNGNMSVSVTSARIGADTGKIPGKMRSARGNLASAGFLVRTGEKRGPREHQRDVWWLTLPGVRLDDADAVHAERLATWWAERLGDEGVPLPVKVPTTAPAPGAWRPVPLSWAPPITLGGMAHPKLRRYRFSADGATVSERRCHRNGSTVLPIRIDGATDSVAQTDCRTDKSVPTRGTDESLPTSVDRRARERGASVPAGRPDSGTALGPRADDGGDGDGDTTRAAAASRGASAATQATTTAARSDDVRRDERRSGPVGAGPTIETSPGHPGSGSVARMGLRAEHDAQRRADTTTGAPRPDARSGALSASLTADHPHPRVGGTPAAVEPPGGLYDDDLDDDDAEGGDVFSLYDLDDAPEAADALSRAARRLRAELVDCVDQDDLVSHRDMWSVIRGAELVDPAEEYDLLCTAVEQGWLLDAGAAGYYLAD